MKQPLPWVPWRVDAWVFGSSRHELTRAQRADFLELVLLSAKDQGFIRANETTPYPITQLAGLLCVPAADLEETIERCIEVGKITRHESGVLYVTNWERYKLTPQYRRRLEQGFPSDSPSKKEEKKREEDRKGEGNTVSRKGTCVSKKGNSSPSPPGKEDLDEDGLLPVPDTLPFKAQDELKERRAEIRRLQRLLKEGRHQDGERRISPERLAKEIKAFNERVADFT
jgi:hypothetical protein